MKRKLLIVTVLAFVMNNLFAQNLTSGNLIVVRIGDGVTALGGTASAVFFDEYKPDGTFVQSVPLRTSIDGVNKRLTLSGDKADEGYITLSPDREKIALFGYDCDPGTTNPSGTAVATINRVIGVLTADKAVNTTKYFNNIFNAVVARSAVANGENLWVTGGGYGIVHTTYNATGAATTNTNLTSGTQTGRVLSIYGGQLYTSTLASGYRMAKVGDGIPTTAGQSLTNLPGLPTTGNPLGYVFVDQNPSIAGVDVLYVADAGGGLIKYSFNGTNWVSNGSIAGTYRGITARVIGSDVLLYGTRSTTTDEFFSLTDNGGHNAPFSTTSVTVLATAATNTIFRGITFAPGTNVLPVSFGEFKGKAIRGAIQLEWETLSEQNNSRFEVLRSQDGKFFEKIGEVKGAGTSNTKLLYSYEDKASIAGNNYYRLRQVDTDGEYSETGIIVVKQSGRSASLQVYVSNGVLKAGIYSSVSGVGKLSVFDLSGKRLYEEQLKLIGGNQEYVIESRLSGRPGVYIAVFTNPQETITQKFKKE